LGLGLQERDELGQAGRDEEVPAAVDVREAGQGGGGGMVVRSLRQTAVKATALGCDRRF